MKSIKRLKRYISFLMSICILTVSTNITSFAYNAEGFFDVFDEIVSFRGSRRINLDFSDIQMKEAVRNAFDEHDVFSFDSYMAVNPDFEMEESFTALKEDNVAFYTMNLLNESEKDALEDKGIEIIALVQKDPYYFTKDIEVLPQNKENDKHSARKLREKNNSEFILFDSGSEMENFILKYNSFISRDSYNEVYEDNEEDYEINGKEKISFFVINKSGDKRYVNIKLGENDIFETITLGNGKKTAGKFVERIKEDLKREYSLYRSDSCSMEDLEHLASPQNADIATAQNAEIATSQNIVKKASSSDASIKVATSQNIELLEEPEFIKELDDRSIKKLEKEKLSELSGYDKDTLIEDTMTATVLQCELGEIKGICFKEAADEGYRVKLRYEEDAFDMQVEPVIEKLSAEDISEDDMELIKRAGLAEGFQPLDIKFIDNYGHEQEPKNGKKVSVEIVIDREDLPETINPDKINVYHIKDNDRKKEIEKKASVKENNINFIDGDDYNPDLVKSSAESGFDKAVASFDTDSFSIYVVGEEVSPKIRTYNFHYIKDGEWKLYNTQRVISGEKLKRPDRPDLDPNMIFKDWYKDRDLNEKCNLDFDKEIVFDVKSDEEINLYARFDEAYYVFFCNDKGEVYYTGEYGKDYINNPDNKSGEDIKINTIAAKNLFDYTTLSDNSLKLVGWSKEKGSENTIGQNPVLDREGNEYKDTVLYPVIKKAFKITYDTDDGSYVPYTYVYEGRNKDDERFNGDKGGLFLPEPKNTPVKKGKVFSAWIDKDKNPVKFNEQIEADTTIYASWADPKPTVRVNIWVQKETDDWNLKDNDKSYYLDSTIECDKIYNYYDPIQYKPIPKNIKKEDIYRLCATNTYNTVSDLMYACKEKYKAGEIPQIKRNEVKSCSGITVKPGNNNTIDIYYDREIRTITFVYNYYQNNNYKLLQEQDEIKGLYGANFPDKAKITKKEYIYGYDSEPEVKNQYWKWDSNYVWVNEKFGRWVFNTAFTYAEDCVFYATNAQKSVIRKFCKQYIDGEYYDDDKACDVIKYDSVPFVFSEKYRGFSLKKCYLSKSEKMLDNIKAGEAIGRKYNFPYDQNITIYYRRHQNTFRLYNAATDITNEEHIYTEGEEINTEKESGVYFEKKIKDVMSEISKEGKISDENGFKPEKPKNLPDYYEFKGWYLDPSCKTPFAEYKDGKWVYDESLKMPDGELNLYAKWDTPKYNVHYHYGEWYSDYNDGKNDGEILSGTDAVDGGSNIMFSNEETGIDKLINDEGILKDDCKDKYIKQYIENHPDMKIDNNNIQIKFVGWFNDADFMNPVDSDMEIATGNNDTLNYYARWAITITGKVYYVRYKYNEKVIYEDKNIYCYGAEAVVMGTSDIIKKEANLSEEDKEKLKSIRGWNVVDSNGKVIPDVIFHQSDNVKIQLDYIREFSDENKIQLDYISEFSDKNNQEKYREGITFVADMSKDRDLELTFDLNDGAVKTEKGDIKESVVTITPENINKKLSLNNIYNLAFSKDEEEKIYDCNKKYVSFGYPERPGYKFIGWSKKKDNSANDKIYYMDSEIFVNGDDGNILFAQWEPVKIHIECKVTGNMGDKNKKFRFNIGKESFELKNGENRELVSSEILENSNDHIEISEENGEYELTVDGWYGNNKKLEDIKLENGTYSFKFIPGEDDYKIVFTNNLEVITPTGVKVDKIPYLVLVIISILGSMAFLVKRKYEFE